ncbi:MAG TPA: pantetheine-phosphate adenylyltransferase [Candidatus Avelusimicrobium excrementipullorum]|nr:pantetheine-phosphate adenylyltransferase [Candidatus Avelusimicrobium excrementipullorum]
MKPKTAVYQGTFDPFTCGHLSVLKSARKLFDEVVVLLLVNPTKTPLFSVAERAEMINAAAEEANLACVRVDSYEGLLADYMHAQGLTCCVRGVRNGRDAEFELENHRLSRVFYPQLQTILLPCDPAWQDVSSSALKAACVCGRVPAQWVPQAVQRKLKEKYPSVVFF